MTVTTNTTQSFLPPGVNASAGGNTTLPSKAEVSLPGTKDAEVAVPVSKGDETVSLPVTKEDETVSIPVTKEDEVVSLPGSKDVPTAENTTSTIINENPSTPTIDTSKEIPANTVRTTLKMDGNFDEFQASGGQAKFSTALATNLGIDSSQITIIDAYAGSIVLLYDITAADG